MDQLDRSAAPQSSTAAERALHMQQEFLLMLQRLHKLMSNRAVLPVTDMEYMTMLRIESCYGGAVNPAKLSLEGVITKSAVSKMLAGMEQKGYLERTRSQNDRRSVTVRLTPAGRRVYRQAAQIVESSFADVSARMGEAETEQLLALAKRWVSCMEASDAAKKARKNRPAQKDGNCAETL